MPNPTIQSILREFDEKFPAFNESFDHTDVGSAFRRAAIDLNNRARSIKSFLESRLLSFGASEYTRGVAEEKERIRKVVEERIKFNEGQEDFEYEEKFVKVALDSILQALSNPSKT